MRHDSPQFATYLFAALFVFLMYWRLRRTFGRQVLRPTQMLVRIVVFAVLAALLVPTALRSAAFTGAAAAGVAAGIVLALWGASQTRFERVAARLYYIPHTYTGIAVSLLFIGRVAFRLLQQYEVSPNAAAAPLDRSANLSSYVNSPLTLGLFFVLVGYYVCYYGLVLWKSKHLSPPAADGGPAASAPPPETLT